uniref:Uncharacterized protein n=1 Tax=Panagrolaimus sp. ES5 TaxID=591445 RepID=A0AC34FHA3_9BILA
MELRHIRKKLVIVGDGGCGKTCILYRFYGQEFPTKYVPTIIEGCVFDQMQVNNTVLEIAPWDTAGQEDYDRLRPLSYPDSDIIIICYAIDNPDSLKNVTKKWIHEVRQYLPKEPIILVGNKIDLRDISNEDKKDHSPQEQQQQKNLITFEEGKAAAKQIRAYAFHECSAKTGKGINATYAKLAQAVWTKKKKIGCCNVG